MVLTRITLSTGKLIRVRARDLDPEAVQEWLARVRQSEDTADGGMISYGGAVALPILPWTLTAVRNRGCGIFRFESGKCGAEAQFTVVWDKEASADAWRLCRWAAGQLGPVEAANEPPPVPWLAVAATRDFTAVAGPNARPLATAAHHIAVAMAKNPPAPEA